MLLSLRAGAPSGRLAALLLQQVARGLRKQGHAVALWLCPDEGGGARPTDRSSPLMESLLQGRIDLAVLGLAHLPLRLPEGLGIAAILPREDPADVLVARAGLAFLSQPGFPAVVATGSTCRRAQWLARYPGHRVVPAQSSVHARLAKLYGGGWDAALFSATALLRLGLHAEIHSPLPWLVPAPGQGAIAVLCRSADANVRDALAPLHHEPSARAVGLERRFLQILQEAGCLAPVGALATLAPDGGLAFEAAITAPDGNAQVRVAGSLPAQATATQAETAAQNWAAHALTQGAAQLAAPGVHFSR